MSWVTPELLAMLVKVSYLVAATLFLLGLQRMASPMTARSGIRWAGLGMLIATVATFLHPQLNNHLLIFVAVVIGTAAAWISANRVAITDMPQMVALYNGMGGGSAAAIGAVELLRYSSAGGSPSRMTLVLAVVGALIGAVSLSGSIIAWAKLDGRMDKRYTFPGQQWFNAGVALAAVILGVMAISTLGTPWIIAFFIVALALGILMTLPIGGADMPVVISLLNSYSGIAAAMTGFVIGNEVLIVSGALVGSSGIILSQIMCKAMNRSLTNVLFGAFGATVTAGGKSAAGLTVNSTSVEDAAVQLAYAQQVVIVPGYGLAVAQAQHQVRELMELIEKQGGVVKFAIHPVAGRMPGHMNVLLAEANIPYDKLFDMEDINSEFERTDVALVIGANDVVNPAARSDPSSPIFGMPILNADYAKRIIVLKRGMSAGFAGIENELFYDAKTQMLFGDAKASLTKLVGEIKAL